MVLTDLSARAIGDAVKLIVVKLDMICTVNHDIA